MVNIDKVKNIIEEIKSINCLEISFNSIFEKIQELIKGYQTIHFKGYNKYIYRARRNEKCEKDIKSFNNKHELWCRNDSDIKEYGRVNWPGYSAFYGSDNLKVAILEKNPKVGDWFTVMKCKNNGFSKLNLVGFGFLEGTIFMDPKGKKIPWEDFRINKLKLSNEEKETNCLVNSFLNRVFRDKDEIINQWGDDRYKITAAISKMWLDNPSKRSIKLDGLCYPTIKEKLYFSNYAFSKESADKFLEADSFFLFEVCEGKPFGRFALKLVDYAMAITLDGRIRWENIIMK